MKSTVRLGMWMALLAGAATAGAQDQIPWAASVEQARQAAAQSNRLVMLHFYSDDCPPCRRLEQNVFNQPHVGQAVAAGFVPVKVHAARSPELVRRYQVRGWPTDVFITPSGLEVHSQISPQQAEEYVAMVQKVAVQSGVGSRQSGMAWNQVPPAGQAMIPALAADHQAGRLLPGDPSQHLSQRQWSPQAQDAANAYAQYAGEAPRQPPSASGAQGSHYAQQPSYSPQHRVDARAQQLGDAARSSTQQWQQALEQSRSGQRPFPPQDQILIGAPFGGGSPFAAAAPLSGGASTSPASAAPAAAAPGGAYATHPAAAAGAAAPGSAYAAPPPSAPPAQGDAPSAAPPLLPAENPWLARSPAQPSAARSDERPAASGRPATGSISDQFAADPPPFSTPAPTPDSGFVPASQAPPTALDGFCPVTLLETMETKGPVPGAWKKGDSQFGAIHRGKTYLFVSEAAQSRFLADPDAYSPVLAGCDPVRYAETGELAEGRRAYGLVYGKRIFLFADEASLNRFDQTPAAFADTAHQAMLRSEAGSVYR